MKKSALYGYFHRTRANIVNGICIGGIIICAVIFGVVPNGVIALMPGLVLVVVLIFLQAARTKDAEVDAILHRLLGAEWENPDPDTTLGAYDLSAPTVKGKDGQLRSTRYVASRYLPTQDGLHISVCQVDLLTETAEREEYDLPPGALVLTETRVPTSIGLKTRYAWTASALPADIPVSMDDVPSAELVRRVSQL